MKWKLVPIALFLFLLLIVTSGAAIAHRGTAKPTMLHVIRTVLPGWNIPPLDVTVRTVTEVQRLYHAAYELPLVPQEMVACPLDIGLVYHLDFFQDSLLVQTMEVHPTGCPYVQRDSDTEDMATLTPAFSALLARMLGIPALVPPFQV